MSASWIESSKNTVYCFERREIIGYLLFSWYVKKCGSIARPRKVLYLNDGLLSSIFDADKTQGYRAFAADHLPQCTGMCRKLISLLPLTLRAEKRYVALGITNLTGDETPGADDSSVAQQDFMFFSNASGKLLLTSAETLLSGKGLVIKTASLPAYTAVMEKEFATMRYVLELQGEAGALPRLGRRFQAGRRVFFTEAYLRGKSLREVLHRLSRRNATSELLAFFGLLDDWFEKYRAAFVSEPQPVISCYLHLLQAFSELYGSQRKGETILKHAKEALTKISRKNAGIIPITSHNDLWPGNFVVVSGGLVAIDWERAAENRAPLFDYYWMIVSAALEHLICKIGVTDYSRAFQLFAEGQDEIAQHAAVMLKTFLNRLGFDSELHRSFLLLFLMEWSVQGYLALGKQTAMDRLAFNELVGFDDAATKDFPSVINHVSGNFHNSHAGHNL